MNHMKNRIRSFVYHPGWEKFSGFLASIYHSVRLGSYHKFFYINGVWIHQYRAGYTTDRHINPGNSLQQFQRNAQDYWTYLYTPKAGDVIVDIGAGKGEDSYYFSHRVGVNGKVFSIEAHPNTFQCLKEFCKYNNLRNVIPLDIAICDKECEIIIDNNDCDLFSTIVQSSTGFRVRGVPFDTMVGSMGISRIDLLKMNIEGAERMAIDGMVRSVGMIRYVCISCHDFLAEHGGVEAMRTKRVISEFLVRNGFQIISRDKDPRPYVRDQVNAVNTRFNR